MLEKSTNNTGIDLPKSRYRALLRLVLQWRHLKMLKRGGRGNDPTGVEGTKNGELAVLCPSCPYPDINLPTGWRDAPPEMQFLYFLIRCIDANFRLMNQLVSSYSADPGLGIGMSYMVPREPYESYLIERINDEEVRVAISPPVAYAYLRNLTIDQQLRRLFSASSGKHPVLEGFADDRSGCGFLREVRDDSPKRSRQPSEGRAVRGLILTSRSPLTSKQVCEYGLRRRIFPAAIHPLVRNPQLRHSVSMVQEPCGADGDLAGVHQDTLGDADSAAHSQAT